MKKMYLALLIIGLVLVSCGGSEKGAWSDEDKAEAKKELEAQDWGIVEGEFKTKAIDCCLKKMEQNYESLDAANADEAGCKKIGEECGEEIAKEILGGK